MSFALRLLPSHGHLVRRSREGGNQGQGSPATAGGSIPTQRLRLGPVSTKWLMVYTTTVFVPDKFPRNLQEISEKFLSEISQAAGIRVRTPAARQRAKTLL